MEFSRPETGVGSHSLLQGIFPTQESNQGLLRCRQILYLLSYQGSQVGVGKHTYSYEETVKLMKAQVSHLRDLYPLVISRTSGLKLLVSGPLLYS